MRFKKKLQRENEKKIKLDKGYFINYIRHL
jgi:hypothetical protein